MTPKVNLVANSESRIRQLEDEVRALRNQLLEAERQKQLNRTSPPSAHTHELSAGGAVSSEREDDTGVQLQIENDTLRQDKEALARCAAIQSHPVILRVHVFTPIVA